MGTTQSAIARLEGGRVSPSVETLRRYSFYNRLKDLNRTAGKFRSDTWFINTLLLSLCKVIKMINALQ